MNIRRTSNGDMAFRGDQTIEDRDGSENFSSNMNIGTQMGDRNKNMRQMTDRQMSNRHMEDTDRQMSRRRFMSNMDQHQMIDQQSYSSRRPDMTAGNPMETNNRDMQDMQQNDAYINDGSMDKQMPDSNMDPMKERRLFENRLDSMKMPESQMSAKATEEWNL